MTRETYKEWLEHAPAAKATPKDLRGHWTAEGYYLCASCASRIFGRGFMLPGATPVWKDSAEPFGVCVGCDE